MDDNLQGYTGRILQLLKNANVKVGDQIRILKNKTAYDGILIPRSEIGDDKHIVIKMRSGYNIGIKLTSETIIIRLGSRIKPSFIIPSPPVSKSNLPKITIISTGGTIASRVDYRTGAVRPVLSANDLYSIIPELSELALIDAEVLFNVFSEDLTPTHWKKLAKTISYHIEDGSQGIVVTHGTDTMGYTSAALSFALQNLPVPVILVGAQRSEDRPSSDATTNMIAAVLTASKAPFAEVSVAMHENISDEIVQLHRGTKVRKLHTSRRDAFKTINSEGFGKVRNRKVVMLTDLYRKRSSCKVNLKPDFEEKVVLIKFFPSLNPNCIKWYLEQGYKGIIFEGSGLGHIRQKCFTQIKNAIDKGVIVGMASQCIYGRVNMNVYTNGRDLKEIGVIPLEDMLAETALVKLMWVLGQTRDCDKAKELLMKNIAFEISKRSVEKTTFPKLLIDQ
jgi:glutamyl-tRNA(Gln) amidotransferase subunit D